MAPGSGRSPEATEATFRDSEEALEGTVGKDVSKRGLFWEEVIDAALDVETGKHIAEQLAWQAREPQNPRPYYNLGVIYHMQRKIPEALKMLNGALSVDARFAPAHREIGLILASQGETDRAWEHAHQAAELGDSSLVEMLRRYPQAT